MLSKERAGGCVVEFLAIVGLEAHDVCLKLSMNKRMERNECGKNIKLVTDGKGPGIMCVIIQDNKIKFETSITHYGGCPYITMQKLKRKMRDIIGLAKG